MDIYSLALWSSLAAQGTVNTSNSIGNNLSFSKLLSEAKIKENMTIEDMFSVAFPTCDVNMKVGECNVSDNLWQRKDFPVWKYYTVISGGKNGKEITTEESAAEDKLELQKRIIQNMKYRLMMAPFRNGIMGNLGMSGDVILKL